MNQVRPADIARIARCLDPLETRMVFLGGAIVPLLLDKPGLSDIRQTMDIDLVVEVVTRLDYSKIEEKLIALKFAPEAVKMLIVGAFSLEKVPTATHGGEICACR